MREREEEIRNIHKGMHQVNEIYKVRILSLYQLFAYSKITHYTELLCAPSHIMHRRSKDLAHLVDNQQEGIDQIETQMENTKENTATGLKHIEKANEHQQGQCVIS